MFETMHKYRALVLVLLLFGLVGFGVWGSLATLFEGGRENPVYGQFRVPGSKEPTEVRYSDWQQAYRLVGNKQLAGVLKLGHPEDDSLAAWEYLVALHAAKDSGVPVSDQEVENLVRFVAATYGIMTPQGKDPRKVIPEEYFDLTRNWITAWKFRNLQENGTLRMDGGNRRSGADPAGRSYEEIWKQFGPQNEKVKVEYVAFQGKDASAFKLDMENKQDQLKLTKWWNDNPAVHARKPIPESLDLELVWVNYRDESIKDFNKIWDEKFKSQITEDMVASEADMLSRWNKNTGAWKRLLDIEKEARKKENPTGDQPSDYEIVKPRIKQEIELGRLMAKFAEEAKKLPAETTLEALAKKHAFNYEMVEKKDSGELSGNLDYGKPRWTTALFRAARANGEDKLKAGQIFEAPVAGDKERYVPGIFDQPAELALTIRYRGFNARRNPELHEVRDWAIEEYQKEKAANEVKERAEAFKKAVDDFILAKIKAKDDELKAKRDKTIADEIAKQKLDEKNPSDKVLIDALKDRAERDYKAALSEEKSSHEAEAFAAVAKAQNLQIKTTPFLNKAPGRSAGVVRYDDDPSQAEKERRIFRVSQRRNRLASLDAGRLSGVENEPQAGMAVVALVKEKKAADPSELYLDPYLSARAISRARPAAFSYENLKDPRWFGLEAKKTDEDLEAKRKKEEDMNRRREARRRAREAQRNGGKPTTEDIDRLPPLQQPPLETPKKDASQKPAPAPSGEGQPAPSKPADGSEAKNAPVVEKVPGAKKPGEK